MPSVRECKICFVILMLVVPAQYIITLCLDATSSQKYSKMLEIKSAFSHYTKYLAFESWGMWCLKLYDKIGNFGNQVTATQKPFSSMPEPTREQENNKKVYYFATSSEPRTPRPEIVKFRVGQVVRHKGQNYRGIIYGWDEKTLAPQNWLHRIYGNSAKKVLETPSYSILVDARDQARMVLSYVAQEDLVVLTGTKILNDHLEEHFESFDGNAYTPRPKLRKLYPDD